MLTYMYVFYKYTYIKPTCLEPVFTGKKWFPRCFSTVCQQLDGNRSEYRLGLLKNQYWLKHVLSYCSCCLGCFGVSLLDVVSFSWLWKNCSMFWWRFWRCCINHTFSVLLLSLLGASSCQNCRCVILISMIISTKANLILKEKLHILKAQMSPKYL